MVPRNLRPCFHPLPLLGALVPLVLGGTASAQAKPDAPAPTGIGVDAMRAAHGAAFVDGELWGAGPGYKARFSPRGIEFHPALGPAAPRNFPLVFELEAVLRGGEVVLAPGAVEPELGADGVVRYARAPGVVERYETRPDGIEQSFVFQEPLAGTGDLVVRGRITTELAAALGEHETLDFLLPELGGVRFGRVTGVDAAGRTVPGSLHHDGAVLELVLPAEFVETAAYPLVLDPLIGGQLIIGGDGVNDATNPDVAYDAGNTLYLVAWEVEFSSTDSDIRALRIATDGAPVGGPIFLETSVSTLALKPTVANALATRTFLVAWQEKTIGSFAIKARSVHAFDGTTSSQITVDSHPQDLTDPDAAGEPTTASSIALLVWRREGTGIFGARVQVNLFGDPSVVNMFTVVVSPVASKPAIAQSMGTPGRALVTYNYFFGPGNTDVHAALVDRNGALLVGPQAIAASNDAEYDPAVDGNGSEWVVAYVRGFPGEDTEIASRKVAWSSGSTLQVSGETLLTSDTLDQVRPAVAWMPGKAFVAWEQHFFLFSDVYVKGVDPADCGTCEPIQPLGLSPKWDGEVRLVSQFSGGSSGDQVFATWLSSSWDGGLFYHGYVKGRLLEAFGGGSVANLGGGCGSGGTLSATGAVAAGNPNLELRLQGADPTAFAALLVLKPPSAPLSCGSCSVILPGMSFPMSIFAGAASQILAVPCAVAAVGAQMDAQVAVLGTGATPCPLFGQVSASNRLRLTIGQ